MQIGNPALRHGIKNSERSFGKDRTFTAAGVSIKTVLMLIPLIITFAYTWQIADSFVVPATSYETIVVPSQVTPLLWIGCIGGLIVGIITIFAPKIACVTGFFYAGLEGLVLGALSATFEAAYPGIAIQAAGLTIGVLVTMLVLYSSGVFRVTNSFIIGVVAATGGIVVIYFISIMLQVFTGSGIPMIHEAGWPGIGFSAFVVCIAALNLVIDFHQIQEAEKKNAPAYMEWYCAFSLMVTLIWLYLETLRLIAKVRGK